MVSALSLALVPAAPIAANPGDNVWDTQAIPSNALVGAYTLLDGAAVMGVMDQAIDGALYAFDSLGTTTSDLFKSTTDGHTWTVTGAVVPATGVNTIVCSPVEADVLYFADGASPGNSGPS